MEAFAGRSRVVIESVQPELDGGRFPIKRIVGEAVSVEVDCFCDGHDLVRGVLLFRHSSDAAWSESELTPLRNDRFQAEFVVHRIGLYAYTIQAWVDRFGSWNRDMQKRIASDLDIELHLCVGIDMVSEALQNASRDDRAWLEMQIDQMQGHRPIEERLRTACHATLADRMRSITPREFSSQYERELSVVVDRQRARFSTWYELFPRSCGNERVSDGPLVHGTFADVESQLPRIAKMGFDVLYLPPIHPIGLAFRKGKNNSTTATESDVGSPWGIGSADGGHLAIHPELGSIKAFQGLVKSANDHGIEMAMDLAYQCSPDHPWVKEHPSWFRRRPDGSIQYAENPPKKYQDIYPIDFESEDWQSLWRELANVVFYWIEQGIHVFRVDNPHTKAFLFWEWMIKEVKSKQPDILFLAEAFTRPKVMNRLAKIGFSQSYTYFTWRNTKQELTDYFTQLNQSELKEYFRPNVWPNTPDILPEYLQFHGRPGFVIRLVLAATLGANYGIYGPLFEQCVGEPVAFGKEEYLDSEKYQLHRWTIDGPHDISDTIAHVNRIRHNNRALQSDHSLAFHETDNPELICYGKHDRETGNRIIVVVNLDPRHAQSGWIELELDEFGIRDSDRYHLVDLFGGGNYCWQGRRNFVMLDPKISPAHVFLVRHHLRTEHDFDYFL